MSGDWTSIQVVAILFTATFIRSTFGFGEALLAVPLLSLIIPVDVAVPLAVLVSILIAALIVLQDWRRVQVGSAGRLVLATLVGTPLGLLLLTSVAEPIVKTCLAVVIILFSTYCLARRPQARLADDRLAWLFGFGAGILGGAYGMNGPPLVVYGALRGWSPQDFRATLQGYFLPASAMAMTGYWLVGLWTPSVTSYFLLVLPGVVLAVLLGRRANRRLHSRGFLVAVHVGLIVVGVVLLSQAILRSLTSRYI